MNVQPANPTTTRTLLTWLCAVSPFAMLFVFATIALHIQLGLRFWPEQVVARFPALDFAAHRASCAIATFFTIIAAIHLLVTLIHHRELGVRLRVCLAQAFLYGAGGVTFIVTVASVPARFLKWFLD